MAASALSFTVEFQRIAWAKEWLKQTSLGRAAEHELRTRFADSGFVPMSEPEWHDRTSDGLQYTSTQVVTQWRHPDSEALFNLTVHLAVLWSDAKLGQVQVVLNVSDVPDSARLAAGQEGIIGDQPLFAQWECAPLRELTTMPLGNEQRDAWFAYMTKETAVLVDERFTAFCGQVVALLEDATSC